LAAIDKVKTIFNLRKLAPRATSPKSRFLGETQRRNVSHGGNETHSSLASQNMRETQMKHASHGKHETH